MARFYLNIHNGIGLVKDEEGREFAGLSQAREAAIEGIRSLVSEDAKMGLLDLTGRIEIVDAEGNVLCEVPYEEAMDLRTARTR